MSKQSIAGRAGAVLAVLAALLLAACGGQSGGGQTEGVLKVASQRGSTKAIMEASGVLEGAPYKVQWSEFAAASPLLEALSAGAVDVGGVGDAPFIFAFAAGAPIKAVLAYDASVRGTSTAVVVPKGSPINSVAELKGRKVATVKGSIGHFLLLRLLEQAGVKASEVDVVFLDPGSTRGALTSGAVDAWATWSPYIGLATLHDGGRVLADGGELLTGAGFFAASDKAVAGKEAILQDFLIRLRKAQDWAVDHPDQYGEVLARETGLPLDVARDAARRSAGRVVPIDQDLVRREYETLETFIKAGLIPSPPRIEGAFEPKFSQAVLTAPAG